MAFDPDRLSPRRPPPTAHVALPKTRDGPSWASLGSCVYTEKRPRRKQTSERAPRRRRRFDAPRDAHNR